jgi:elongation factor P
MASYGMNDVKNGMKILVNRDPCVITETEYVKPGKGQAFTRIKYRNIKTGRVVEMTLKATDSLEAADVMDTDMQFLYADGEYWHFMQTDSFEQVQADKAAVGDRWQWLKGEEACVVTLWNGSPIAVQPPNFVELKIVETDPGVRGDTSGGGGKPAKLETGAPCACRCSSARKKSSRSTPVPVSTSAASSNPPTARACALVVEAGWIVPVEPAGLVLEDHALVVDEGRILALLPREQARASTRRASAFAARRVLLPGLVNAHTHNPMTLMRGVADDLPLMPWLTEHVWPAEAAVMSPAFIADGCELAVAEMLRGGTTCCNENYFFPTCRPRPTAPGLPRRGRHPVIEFPSAWAATPPSTSTRASRSTTTTGAIRWCPSASRRTRPTPSPTPASSASAARRAARPAGALPRARDRAGSRGFAQAARPAPAGAPGPPGPGQRAPDRGAHDAAHRRGDRAVRRARRVGRALPAVQPQARLGLLPGREAAPGRRQRRHRHRRLREQQRPGHVRRAAQRRAAGQGLSGDATAWNAAYALRAATLGGARAIGLGERIGSLETGQAGRLHLRGDGRWRRSRCTTRLAAGVQQRPLAGARRLDRRRDAPVPGELVDFDSVGLLERVRRWRDTIAAVRAPQ